MSEQLQQALIGLITKLTDTITSVGSSIAEHVPELVRQLIGFNILKYWVWVGIETAVLISFPIFIYWSVGLINNRLMEHDEAKKLEQLRMKEDYWVGNAWFCTILGIIWAAAGISIVWDVTQLIKLYNFPLVWTLDYLQSMVK